MQDAYQDFQNASSTFYLSYKKAEGHYTMPSSHFHDRYEIYYLLSGERSYFIKDRTFFVKKGDLVLINPDDLHKTIDTGVPNHERVLLKFSKEFISADNSALAELLIPLFEVNVIHFTLPAQSLVEDLLRKMFQEIETRKNGFELSLQSLLIQLLVFAKRYLEVNPPATLDHPSPVHRKISEIVQYLNGHYPEAVTLAKVSKQFFISSCYLSRTFKEVTGFTFIEYLNSIRIKEAQRLLRETRLKAGVIAEKVGFGSIAHFGRVFKTVTGQSPLAYRKLSRI